MLEIGSWEGRSAVFLLTHLCASGGELVCIDHFDLMQTAEGRARYARVMHNLGMTQKPSRVIAKFSVPALMTLLEEEISSSNAGFDWIYVDGSHEADDTFLDGELAWRLARKGAVVIFDDYRWNKEPEESAHHPKRGIDSFLVLHVGEYEILSGSEPHQYQMILRKLTDMRIGFLVEEQAGTDLTAALGYGINLAFTIDSEYAMAASVAIQSAVESTAGRISIYVVDCGLTEDDKNRIRLSTISRDDVTLVFLAVPDNSLAAELGAQWAKIDMITVLPVERILYLDADVLVRRDLKELWYASTDGKPIAAAIDVGFPMGHVGVGRTPYFNAGVLLIDLAQVRVNVDELVALSRAMTTSKFQDQDVLNCHFRGRWSRLSLSWNAQGLGTYANLQTPEREHSFSVDEMEHPGIVHFTGPVHPSMADVINPYLQPYTAKPWGYAASPGHPYSVEWWHVAERTEWTEWRKAEGEDKRHQRQEKAMREGIDAFRAKMDEVRSIETL